MNCANVDCNRLFVSCPICMARLKGCCCEGCKQAPRLLRPALEWGGRYGQWGNYVAKDGVADDKVRLWGEVGSKLGGVTVGAHALEMC